MQGDSYDLGIRIVNNAGSSVTQNDVIDVEITIGRVSKSLSNGQVRYDSGVWLYPISQKESMAILPGKVSAQVRVVWNDGSIEGTRIDGVRMHESLSREVL